MVEQSRAYWVTSAEYKSGLSVSIFSFCFFFLVTFLCCTYFSCISCWWCSKMMLSCGVRVSSVMTIWFLVQIIIFFCWLFNLFLCLAYMNVQCSIIIVVWLWTKDDDVDGFWFQLFFLGEYLWKIEKIFSVQMYVLEFYFLPVDRLCEEIVLGMMIMNFFVIVRC